MTLLDNILAGLAAGLLVALGVLLVMNANLRADIAVAHSNAAALTRANEDLKNQVETQNNAVLALKAASVSKARAAAKAVKAAEMQAKIYADAASRVVKPPGDDCVAATQVLRDYLKKP